MKSDWHGLVTDLHITDRASAPMLAMPEITLIAGSGIQGDRYALETGYYSDRPEPGRQITLFEIETLEALKRDHGVTFSTVEHRRNVTTRGVPLNHLVGKHFALGETLLLATRLSTPCQHIQDVTGKNVSRWLIHRSGLNCIILKGGIVRIGDTLKPA